MHTSVEILMDPVLKLPKWGSSVIYFVSFAMFFVFILFTLGHMVII